MFQIAKNRPLLQAVLALYAGGVAFALMGQLAIGAALALVIVSTFAKSARLLALVLCLNAGALYYAAHTGVHRRTNLVAEALPSEAVTIRGRVATTSTYQGRFSVFVLVSEDGAVAPGTRIAVYTAPFNDFLPGEGLRVAGRLRPADEVARRRLGVVARTSVGTDMIVRERATNLPFHAAVAFLRSEAERAYSRWMFQKEASITAGVVFGDPSMVPSETREALKRSGTYHLLAASGLHVGVVAGLLMMVCALLRIPRGFSHAFSILGVVAYAVSTGASPATARAAVAIGVYLLANVLRRQPDALTALAAGAAYQFVRDPMSIQDASFQLSYAIAGGLIVWCPPLSRYLAAWLRRLKPRSIRWALFGIGGSLLVSSIASIAGAPILAYHFQSIPLLGPVSNLVCVPLTVPIIWSGLLGPAGWFVPGWSDLLLHHIAQYSAYSLATIGESLSDVSWASVYVAAFSPVWLVPLYTVFFGTARDVARRVE